MALNLGTLLVHVGVDMTNMVAGFNQAQKMTANMEKAMTGFGKTASGLLVPTSALGKNLEDAGRSAATAAAKIDQTGAAVNRAKQHVHDFTDSLASMHTQLKLMVGGAALTAVFTVPFVSFTKGALQAAIGFESAFAGVRKTVDATEAEFAQLEANFRSMAQSMPIAAEEFARIGELAGQLGVRGVNEITEFTKAVAELGVTTNLSTEEAATSLARFANIMQMPISDVGRLGATIVELGNNFATTEAELTEFALRIAGAGKQIGISEAQVLAFGAALSSVGVRAEAGGTALQRVFIDLATAVANGGTELNAFARVAGMSASEFATAFRDDAAMAVTAFIEGLRRIQQAGGNVFQVLSDLDQNEQRVMRTLLSTAGAGDLLRKALNLASDAWRENTALVEEAAKRFGTSESQIKTLINTFRELQRQVGEILVPKLIALGQTALKIIEVFQKLPEPIKGAALAIGGLFAAIGPILLALAGVAAIMAGVTTAINLLTPVISAMVPTWAGLMVAIQGVRNALIAMRVAFLANFALVATIAVIAGMAGLLIANWRKIGDFFGAMWDRVVAEFNSAKAAINVVLKELQFAFAKSLDFIFGNVSRFVADILAKLSALKKIPGLGWIVEAEETAAKFVSTATEGYLEKSAKALDAAKANWRSAAATVKDARKAAADATFELGQGMADTTDKIIAYVASLFKAKDATDDAASMLAFYAAEEESARKASEELAKSINDAMLNAWSNMQTETETTITALDILEHRLSRLDAAWKIQKANMDSNISTTDSLGQREQFLQSKLALVAQQMEILQGQLDKVVLGNSVYTQETMELAKALDSAAVQQAELRRELADTGQQLKDEAQKTADATKAMQDKARALMQAELAAGNLTRRMHEVGGSLQDARMDFIAAESALNSANVAVEQAQNEYAEWKRGLDRITTALDATKSRISAVEQAIADARGSVRSAFADMADYVSNLERQIDSARRAMMDLTGTRFVGEGAIEQQLQELRRQELTTRLAINAVQQGTDRAAMAELERRLSASRLTQQVLQISGGADLPASVEKAIAANKLEQDRLQLELELLRRASQSGTASLEAKLEEIGLQREKLMIERELNFDMLRDELKRLTDTSKELTFDEAKTDILNYQQQIAGLTVEQDKAKSQLEEWQQTMASVLGETKLSFDEAVVALGRHKAAIESNQAILGQLQQTYAAQQSILASVKNNMEALKNELELKLIPAQDAAAQAFEAAKKRAEELGNEHDRLREESIKLREAMQALRTGTGNIQGAIDAVQKATARAMGLPEAAAPVLQTANPAELVKTLSAEQLRQFAVRQIEMETGAAVSDAVMRIINATALEQLERNFVQGAQRIKDTLSNIPGFARGGMVPGPIGAPVLAKLHGGEEVLTPAQQQQRSSNNITLNITINGADRDPEAIGREVAEWVVDQLERKGIGVD